MTSFFHVHVTTDTIAFQRLGAAEVRRILAEVISEVDGNNENGVIEDADGVAVGYWVFGVVGDTPPAN